jgi:very-short-patch-repair endonuclease
VIFPPEILELAATQHQLVAYRQAVPKIVTPSWWVRRLQSGALIPVFRGVSRLVGSETSTLQKIHAAVLSVNRGSLASHRTAAMLLGADLIGDEPIDVTVPNRRVEMARPGVLLHQPADGAGLLPDVTEGIAHTNAARTLVDLGAVATERTVARVVETFVIAKTVTVSQLAVAVDRNSGSGRDGAGVLRRVLTDSRLGARPPDSVLEAHVLRMLHRRGLPELTFQHEVRVGTRTYRIDFADPIKKIGFEFNGWSYHGGQMSFERDARRLTDLASVGYRIATITWRQVMFDEDWVVKRMWATLELRGQPPNAF